MVQAEAGLLSVTDLAPGPKETGSILARTTSTQVLNSLAAPPQLWPPRSSQLLGLLQALEDMAPTPSPREDGCFLLATCWAQHPGLFSCLIIGEPEISRQLCLSCKKLPCTLAP